MGTKALRNRKKWQDKSGKKAVKAEKGFYRVFQQKFKDSDYQIRAKPKEFKEIYSKVKLGKKVMDEIYSPKEKVC